MPNKREKKPCYHWYKWILELELVSKAEKVRASTFMVYGYRLIYSRPLLSLLNLYLLIFASDVWLESIGFAVDFYHCHGKGATETQISFHPTYEFGQIISLLFFCLYSCVLCTHHSPHKHIESMLLMLLCFFFSLSRDRLSIFPHVHLLCCYFFFALCSFLKLKYTGTWTQKRCLKTGCYQTQSHQRLSTFSK